MNPIAKETYILMGEKIKIRTLTIGKIKLI
jgi:hypothetical protein